MPAIIHYVKGTPARFTSCPLRGWIDESGASLDEIRECIRLEEP